MCMHEVVEMRSLVQTLHPTLPFRFNGTGICDKCKQLMDVNSDDKPSWELVYDDNHDMPYAKRRIWSVS